MQIPDFRDFFMNIGKNTYFVSVNILSKKHVFNDFKIDIYADKLFKGL